MLSRIAFFRLALIVFTAAILALAAPSLHAEEAHDYSQSEMTGFAFYKLARKTPNFDDWINAAEAAQKDNPDAKPIDRAAQKARLQKGFNDFTAGQDVIAITTTGVVNLPAITPKEEKNFKDEKPVELVLGESADMTYFPVQIGKVWIAVVPSEEEAFKTVMLRTPEYERLRNVLSLLSAQNAGAGIRMSLKPMRVDTHAAIMLNGKKMWLMMAEIEILEVWDQQFKHMAWSYNASGYRSDETEDLMKLYSGK